MPTSASPSGPEILSLNGILKEFPGVRALSGVSLTLYAGEVTALVGENGAGKSTVVKILTGIHQPDAGQMLLNGSPITLPTQRRCKSWNHSHPPRDRAV